MATQITLDKFLAADAATLAALATATRDKAGKLDAQTIVEIEGELCISVQTYKGGNGVRTTAAAVQRRNYGGAIAWGRVISFVRPSILAGLNFSETKRATAKALQDNQLHTLTRLQDWLKRKNQTAALMGECFPPLPQLLRAMFKDNGELTD